MSHHTEKLTTSEHDTFNKMISEGNEAADLKQWKVAQKRFIALLHFARASRNPDRQEVVVRAYSGLGSVLCRQGKHHLALKIHDQAIYYHTEKVGMVLAKLYAMKGAIWGLLGDTEAALQWSDEGIKAASDDDSAQLSKFYALKSLMWERLGNDEAALQWADEGIKATPNDHLAYVPKITLLLKMAKAEEALALIKSRTEATEPATVEMKDLFRDAKKSAEALLVKQGGAVWIE